MRQEDPQISRNAVFQPIWSTDLSFLSENLRPILRVPKALMPNMCQMMKRFTLTFSDTMLERDYRAQRRSTLRMRAPSIASGILVLLCGPIVALFNSRGTIQEAISSTDSIMLFATSAVILSQVGAIYISPNLSDYLALGIKCTVSSIALFYNSYRSPAFF